MAAYGRQEEKFFFGEKEVEVDQGLSLIHI